MRTESNEHWQSSRNSDEHFYGFWSAHSISVPTDRNNLFTEENLLFCAGKKQPEGPCRCSDISVMTLVAFVKKQRCGWFPSKYSFQLSSQFLSAFVSVYLQAYQRSGGSMDFHGKQERKTLKRGLSNVSIRGHRVRNNWNLCSMIHPLELLKCLSNTSVSRVAGAFSRISNAFCTLPFPRKFFNCHGDVCAVS